MKKQIQENLYYYSQQNPSKIKKYNKLINNNNLEMLLK